MGALGALNRVYLNIGLFSEEWLLHFRPLVGGKPITPIEIAVANKNSAYWEATEAQTPDMALFFLKSTAPHLSEGCARRRRLPHEGQGEAGARQDRVRRALRALPLQQDSRRPRRDWIPTAAPAKTISTAGTSTGRGRRPTTSRRRCARSSQQPTSSTTTISRPTCAFRSRCCRPTPAVRWRPTRSPATSGTTSRRRPTKTCRRSGTITVYQPVTGRGAILTRCRPADADTRVRHR